MSYWKRRSIKRMASDRLKNKTSNNIAALLNSTSDSHPGEVSMNSLTSESPPSQLHSASPGITIFDNLMSTEEELSPAAEVGFRSSHHRKKIPAPPVKKEKQNFEPQFTPMICSKAPEPIWNLDRLDRIIEGNTLDPSTVYRSNPFPFSEIENSGKTTSEPVSEVIDEARNIDLVQEVSRGLTGVPKWQESRASTSAARAADGIWPESEKDPLTRAMPSSEYPTTLEPEPFAETRQRLRFINNEVFVLKLS